MRRLARTLAIAACLGLAAASPPDTPQQSPPATLAIQGHVAHPTTIGLDDLRAMPATSIEVSHPGAKGPQTDRYTGVPLWTLLQAAGPLDRNGPRTHLLHVVRATGSDGYAVALAIGELDPDFEGKPVLVAYAENGQPLPALKLVVPADTKAGRSVRGLVAIDID